MFTSSTNAYSRRVSLLIVEDNPDERLIIEQTLSQVLTDVTVVWANDETVALDYLEQCVNEARALPRLVLLDIYLPAREQGWRFLQTVRDQGWQGVMPVIALRHSNESADILTAYDLGASSYITKPVDIEGWLNYFTILRTYWWHTATLPVK